ncbi:MAG TPA: endo alpha-1,4 polygalactosaminidase [Streptosporangiaceae bacterium]|nr:endo alpha-1,4 polygalactosaminidase [Streptosporangiaceae bacterium]
MTGATGAARAAARLALAAALVLLLATACTTSSKPPAPHHSPTTAPTYPAAISPPVARGTLRVTGVLRDGMPVRAAGLSWLAPRLPRGDKLLSFDVGYVWQACTAAAGGQGGHCAAAADTTATPFAAQRYVAGHADTGKYLKVTVTATEVVETSPATFAFSIFHTSRSYTTPRTVGPYPSGKRPWSWFMNGLPEQRTGSNQEFFQLSPPHYNASNGPVSQRYRVDGGPWQPVPGNRVFETGQLGVGRHSVEVLTADRAGDSAASFRWQVVPLPAPLACTRPHGGACWYPPHLDRTGHPMRWDWQIGRVTPLERTGQRAVDIYDIDGFLTTQAEIRQIHTTWQAATLPHPKTVCYLDLAWEDYRPDGSVAPYGRYFPAATLGNIYYGYPDERWVDFRQLNELKPMLNERIAMCARKGFDAVELDDIDSFDPASTTGFYLTPGDAQNYLAYAFNLVHRYGMTVLWKNTPGLAWWGVRYTDGAVVEECYVYSECFADWQGGTHQDGITCSALHGPTACGWDVFTTDRTPHQPTGKWVGEAEYGDDHYVCNPGRSCPAKRMFATFCARVYAPPDGFAAVKFDVDLDGKVFWPCPSGV